MRCAVKVSILILHNSAYACFDLLNVIYSLNSFTFMAIKWFQRGNDIVKNIA